jgi:hypothetical protein
MRNAYLDARYSPMSRMAESDAFTDQRLGCHSMKTVEWGIASMELWKRRY